MSSFFIGFFGSMLLPGLLSLVFVCKSAFNVSFDNVRGD